MDAEESYTDPYKPVTPVFNTTSSSSSSSLSASSSSELSPDSDQLPSERGSPVLTELVPLPHLPPSASPSKSIPFTARHHGSAPQLTADFSPERCDLGVVHDYRQVDQCDQQYPLLSEMESCTHPGSDGDPGYHSAGSPAKLYIHYIAQSSPDAVSPPLSYPPRSTEFPCAKNLTTRTDLHLPHPAWNSSHHEHFLSYQSNALCTRSCCYPRECPKHEDSYELVQNMDASDTDAITSEPRKMLETLGYESHQQLLDDLRSSQENAELGESLGSCSDDSSVRDKTSTPSSKKRRRRMQTPVQRTAANMRERKRMCHLNVAFDSLKDRLPNVRNRKKLSRIQTLRAAIYYIHLLSDCLQMS